MPGSPTRAPRAARRFAERESKEPRLWGLGSPVSFRSAGDQVFFALRLRVDGFSSLLLVFFAAVVRFGAAGFLASSAVLRARGARRRAGFSGAAGVSETGAADWAAA